MCGGYCFKDAKQGASYPERLRIPGAREQRSWVAAALATRLAVTPTPTMPTWVTSWLGCSPGLVSSQSVTARTLLERRRHSEPFGHVTA
jgi:hypothetical protein